MVLSGGIPYRLFYVLIGWEVVFVMNGLEGKVEPSLFHVRRVGQGIQF